MFDPSWENGCPSCTAGGRREVRRPARAPRTRATRRSLRVPRPAGQARALQGRAGLDVPLVLLARQRLQLRLGVTLDHSVTPPDYNYRPPSTTPGDYCSRPSRRAARARAPSCATATASSTRTRRSRAARRRLGGSYYFLDLRRSAARRSGRSPRGAPTSRAPRCPTSRREWGSSPGRRGPRTDRWNESGNLIASSIIAIRAEGILLSNILREDPHGGGAYGAGHSAALVLAGVMVVAGGFGIRKEMRRARSRRPSRRAPRGPRRARPGCGR